MKRKLSSKQLLLIVLLILPLTFSLNATVPVKEDVVFRTVDNNARFVMGADFNLYKIEANSSHLWMDKSYTSGYYTRYCIYVESPNNANFTITKWFPTKNSEAKITIDAPSSTNINLGFQSLNLLTASASGVVSQTWFSANKTLLMVANTDTNSIIIITVTVNETKETNITPENIAVTITDMDADNWVFSETKYYTFQARYWDGNGYADLDTVKIYFSDGLTTIIPIYDYVTGEWSLESGSDVVRLKAGTLTIIDSNMIQVTFLIYFRNTILDALDVDLFMWCNDTTGASDGWDEIQTDYFNIYNLGGHSELTSSGDAGRLVGGDVFDLYAHNGSWVESTITFRNLQHVKMLPQAISVIDPNVARVNITYAIDYYVEDQGWVEGWSVTLDGAGYSIGTVRALNYTIHWFNRGSLVRTDEVWWYHTGTTEGENSTDRFWIDLWFNLENSSSVAAGRINAYFYPMTDSSNPWLRWLTGSNWGIYDQNPKQSMFFETLKDINGETLYTPQIQMVKLKCKLEVPAVGSVEQLLIVSDYDVFDLTFGVDPFTGVQTPPFDETKVVVMPQGGFLGAVWTALNNLIKSISEAFGPVILGFWNTFVGFLDTVFTWAGWPNGFSQLINWITNLLSWVADSFTYLILLLTSSFTFIMSFIGKMLNTLNNMITQWVTMIQNIFSMISGGFGQTYDIYETLRLDIWITLIAIFYPIMVFGIWEEKGFDAMLRHLTMVINIFVWIGSMFITIIQLFINVITAIIESIPVVE